MFISRMSRASKRKGSPQFPSWLDYTISMSGYDFRKGHLLGSSPHRGRYLRLGCQADGHFATLL
jgi:hypothetical protein